MTTEQKAKAYDEVLNKLRYFIAKGVDPLITRADVQDFFPELSESEDERIREEIISAVNIYCTEYLRGDKVRKDMIAWLRKHVDKVEPKFKVGDWCIDNEDGTIFQIVKVLDNTYTYKTNEGKEYSCSHYSLENDAKLWSIKDAKEGDVLFYRENVKYSDGIKYERICLFKNLDNAFFTLTKNYVEEYDIDVNIDYPDNIMPATKEQKEILFMVMKEAGYVWDTEDKQLKKIEQKHTPKHKIGDTIHYNSFGELKSMIVANVTTGGTDNPMYEDENGNAVFEKDLIEQNLAKWSGEDLPEFESYLCLMFQKFRTKGVCTNGEIVDFVKEHSQKLKDTLCHAWSEEDEEIHRKCICAMRASACSFPEEEKFVEQVDNWLKSLKARNTWKPSDEQLRELRCVISGYSFETPIIVELEEQLKKL